MKNFYCHLINVTTYELIGVECDTIETVYEENNFNKAEWKFICSFDLR